MWMAGQSALKQSRRENNILTHPHVEAASARIFIAENQNKAKTNKSTNKIWNNRKFCSCCAVIWRARCRCVYCIRLLWLPIYGVRSFLWAICCTAQNLDSIKTQTHTYRVCLCVCVCLKWPNQFFLPPLCVSHIIYGCRKWLYGRFIFACYSYHQTFAHRRNDRNFFNDNGHTFPV